MTSNTYVIHLILYSADSFMTRILPYEAVVNNPLSVIKVRSFEREHLNFSLTRHFLKY